MQKEGDKIIHRDIKVEKAHQSYYHSTEDKNSIAEIVTLMNLAYIFWNTKVKEYLFPSEIIFLKAAYKPVNFLQEICLKITSVINERLRLEHTLHNLWQHKDVNCGWCKLVISSIQLKTQLKAHKYKATNRFSRSMFTNEK